MISDGVLNICSKNFCNTASLRRNGLMVNFDNYEVNSCLFEPRKRLFFYLDDVKLRIMTRIIQR